jgi:hypothetical protein
MLLRNSLALFWCAFKEKGMSWGVTERAKVVEGRMITRRRTWWRRFSKCGAMTTSPAIES